MDDQVENGAEQCLIEKQPHSTKPADIFPPDEYAIQDNCHLRSGKGSRMNWRHCTAE